MQLFLSTADMGCGPCSFKQCVVMTSPTLKEALLTRGVSQQAEGPVGQVAVRRRFLLFGESVRPRSLCLGDPGLRLGKGGSSGGLFSFPGDP